MGSCEGHAFFLKCVHFPVNYRLRGEEFASYWKGNVVAAQAKLFRERERIRTSGDHDISGRETFAVLGAEIIAVWDIFYLFHFRVELDIDFLILMLACVVLEGFCELAKINHVCLQFDYSYVFILLPPSHNIRFQFRDPFPIFH